MNASRALLALLAPLLFTHCSALGPMPDWAYTDLPPGQESSYRGSHRFPSTVHPGSPWASTGQRTPSGRTSSPSGRTYDDSSPARFPLDGDVTEGSPGSRTYRDKYTGQIIGSEYTSPAGNTTYRDSSGRITGSSSTSPAGTTTYRDSRGAISITSSTTPGTGGDSTTTYRRNGTIVGTKYVSPVGNVTWRDGNGSIISGPNW